MFSLPFKVKFLLSASTIDSVEIESHSHLHWEIFGHLKDPKVEKMIHSWMEAYSSRKQCKIQLPINTKNYSSYTQSIWSALRKVPFGETITYKELAKVTGRPDAARAVGNACGKNPCLLVIPCHRVIASDGSLGGFSAGLNLKQTLLDFEKS